MNLMNSMNRIKTTPALIAAAVLALSGLSLVSVNGITRAASRPALQDANARDAAMQQQIVAKEREGLDALKAGDIQHFGDLTADEAVLVDAHGPATKAQVLKNVAGFTLTGYSMDDIRFVLISSNTGLISYRITEKGASHGHEFSAQAYVSSVWTERGGKWLCLFSQETGVPRQATP
jgi:ketosteroid isomerase-like protein